MAKVLQTLKSIVMAKFYAVKKGRVPGIYDSWPAAEKQVKGFAAEHKSFKTRAEALAWMSNSPLPAPGPSSSTSRSGATSNPLKRSSATQERPAKRVAENPSGRKVYCDGSALGNGTAGSTAGIGVWSHDVAALNLSERLPGLGQTNNRAEMFALARILELDPSPELPLVICSDSQYTISVFSSWIMKWQRNGWKAGLDNQPVKNKDLICYVLSLIALRQPLAGPSSNLANVSFVKVKAHAGIEGNEQADKFAKAGALMPAVIEREYERDTRRNERRKLERERTHRLLEVDRAAGVVQPEMVLSFSVEFDDCDVLTPEELRQMELDQEFE